MLLLPRRAERLGVKLAGRRVRAMSDLLMAVISEFDIETRHKPLISADATAGLRDHATIRADDIWEAASLTTGSARFAPANDP